jgi:hypothetical protein
MTSGQTSLNNFYRSVQFSNPRIAAAMSEDIVTVSLYGLGGDKSLAWGAVHRLREQAFDLPEIQRRILNNALADLGYS